MARSLDVILFEQSGRNLPLSNADLKTLAKSACLEDRGKDLDTILITLTNRKVDEEDTATELLIYAIRCGCKSDGSILKTLLEHKADVNKKVDMGIEGYTTPLSALEAASKEGDTDLQDWLKSWKKSSTNITPPKSDSESDAESSVLEKKEKDKHLHEYSCSECEKKDRIIEEQKEKIKELQTSLSRTGTASRRVWSSDELPRFPLDCSQGDNDYLPWLSQNSVQTASRGPECTGMNFSSHPPYSEVTTVCAQQEHLPGGDKEYVCGHPSWS